MRDEKTVALDNVVINCRIAADQYDTAVSILENKYFVEKFKELSKARKLVAGKVEEQIREMGFLPMDTDPDRQALRELITWVKSLTASDERLALLEKFESIEKDIQKSIEEAYQKDIPKESRKTLDELNREIEETRNWMKKTKEGLD